MSRGRNKSEESSSLSQYSVPPIMFGFEIRVLKILVNSCQTGAVWAITLSASPCRHMYVQIEIGLTAGDDAKLVKEEKTICKC